MNKFTYGPLSWGEDGNMPDFSEPVGYDNFGIPIDANGYQCLDLRCILHPQHKPKKVVYNEYLGISIPDYVEAKKWFTEHFLEITDEQAKNYVIRWLLKCSHPIITSYCQPIVKKCGSVETFKRKVYGEENGHN